MKIFPDCWYNCCYLQCFVKSGTHALICLCSWQYLSVTQLIIEMKHHCLTTLIFKKKNKKNPSDFSVITLLIRTGLLWWNDSLCLTQGIVKIIVFYQINTKPMYMYIYIHAYIYIYIYIYIWLWYITWWWF